MSDLPNRCSVRRLFPADLRIRCALSVVAVLMPVVVRAQSQPVNPEATWGEPHDLLDSELQTQWTHFSSVDSTRLPDVWERIVNTDQTRTELVCTGTPRGYLVTNEQYSEFDFSFEWRYASDPNGNSGVLVFTQDDKRLWPTSIQIQLHQPEAGSVFPSGAADTDGPHKKEGLANAVGEWNKCHITSRSARVLVHINGKKAGEVKGCKPASGRIAIQSEGSEVHFRRMMIRTPAVAKNKAN